MDQQNNVRSSELPDGLGNDLAVLILDSHSSRGSVGAMVLFGGQEITALTLPSHHTHLLQCVDVAVARPFKTEIRKEAWEHFRARGGTLTSTETRDILLQCIVPAVQKASYSSNVKSGFRRTGLHPFDPNIPLHSPYVRNSPVIHEEFNKEAAKGAEALSSSILTDEQMIALIDDKFNQDDDPCTIMFTPLLMPQDE